MLHLMMVDQYILYSNYLSNGTQLMTIAVVDLSATGTAPLILKELVVSNTNFIVRIAYGNGLAFVVTHGRNDVLYYFNPSQGAAATLHQGMGLTTSGLGQTLTPSVMVYGEGVLYILRVAAGSKDRRPTVFNVLPVDVSMGIPQAQTGVLLPSNFTQTLRNGNDVHGVMLSCDVIAFTWYSSGTGNSNHCGLLVYNVSSQAEIYQEEFTPACLSLKMFRNRIYMATNAGLSIY
eukprot:m.15457 g.15457  ORF g.15457 m.15457 type:complete len:233 (+) comp10468_c0_seq1:1301-1999(+)